MLVEMEILECKPSGKLIVQNHGPGERKLDTHKKINVPMTC